LRHEWSRPH